MEEKQDNLQPHSSGSMPPETSSEPAGAPHTTSEPDGSAPPAQSTGSDLATEESTVEETGASKSKSVGFIVGAAVVAVIVLLALVWFLRGPDSPSSTGIDSDQVIATVNGVDIVGSDLTTSISQISATAQLQGIDITDPSIQSEIQSQAIELLINTEALEQEAENRGIVVTEADVDARIEALIVEIGSEEALNERMVALGINRSTLESDVQSELMIQALLEEEFAAANITVTDEEIEELYQATTGGGENVPSLEQMRSQIETQIRVSKEQSVVDNLIAQLRSEAEIEILQ